MHLLVIIIIFLPLLAIFAWCLKDVWTEIVIKPNRARLKRIIVQHGLQPTGTGQAKGHSGNINYSIKSGPGGLYLALVLATNVPRNSPVLPGSLLNTLLDGQKISQVRSFAFFRRVAVVLTTIHSFAAEIRNKGKFPWLSSGLSKFFSKGAGERHYPVIFSFEKGELFILIDIRALDNEPDYIKRTLLPVAAKILSIPDECYKSSLCTELSDLEAETILITGIIVFLFVAILVLPCTSENCSVSLSDAFAWSSGCLAGWSLLYFLILRTRSYGLKLYSGAWVAIIFIHLIII